MTSELKDLPSSNAQEVEMQITSTNWKSCCFTLDSRVVLFCVQVLFSAFMMGFAASKLHATTVPDPLWVSIMTSMLGIWLPSPTLRSNGPHVDH